MNEWSEVKKEAKKVNILGQSKTKFFILERQNELRMRQYIYKVTMYLSIIGSFVPD